ncbi:MAG TPA: hypothetical protein DDZ53_08910 [Firmicutes bacterium]|nr:hypothetical protein [Bacillota bacterium]
MTRPRDFLISISPEEAAEKIIAALAAKARSNLLGIFELLTAGRGPLLLDDHRIEWAGATVISLVFTKFYSRVGSFVTLIITMDNTRGETAVHLAPGGHKMFVDDDDLGAGAAFMKMVEEILEGYLLPEA